MKINSIAAEPPYALMGVPVRTDDTMRQDELRLVDTRSGKTVGIITNIALTYPKRMGTMTAEAYYPAEVRSGRERSAE